jgi:hypothetical protein
MWRTLSSNSVAASRCVISFFVAFLGVGVQFLLIITLQSSTEDGAGGQCPGGRDGFGQPVNSSCNLWCRSA